MKIGLFAGGVAAAAAATAATKSKTVRKGVVRGVAAAMNANDCIQTATQNLLDDADDVRAEADRKRRIDAIVRQRMTELEKGVREEAAAKVDGTSIEKTTSAE